LERQNINAKSQIPNPKSQIENPVLFVGAGPGDPELITVKGQKALMKADVVIYAGSLVPEELLQWTQPETTALSSASMNLEQIISAVVDARSAGKRVVRLHTGDPSLYGAIFEQMAELQKQGVPYKVIPGVTAAFAAAAALGIEYTLPEISQTLILTRMAGRTPVPEKENLASLASHQASMAIYLSISMIDEVAGILAGAYGARRLGASRWGVTGAILGALVGMFMGFVGIVVGPFVGAVAGELLARRGLAEASRAGAGAWIGLVLSIAARLALVFAMLGVFILAYLY